MQILDYEYDTKHFLEVETAVSKTPLQELIFDQQFSDVLMNNQNRLAL